MSEKTRSRPRAHPAAIAVYTVLGNVTVIVATIFFGMLGGLVGWIPPRARWAFQAIRGWGHCLLWLSGMRVRPSFAAPLNDGGPRIYMVNHSSMFDIPALLTTLPEPARFLAKKILFRIPFFGWAIHGAAFIPVDRKDRSTAKVTFAAAIRALKAGHSILVFPEETRTEDGQLLPFKPGGFLIALKSGRPIVPVGIRGALEARAPYTYVNYPGPIDVRYGEPIDVKSYGIRGKTELIERVRREIEELRA